MKQKWLDSFIQTRRPSVRQKTLHLSNNSMIWIASASIIYAKFENLLCPSWRLWKDIYFKQVRCMLPVSENGSNIVFIYIPRRMVLEEKKECYEIS